MLNAFYKGGLPEVEIFIRSIVQQNMTAIRIDEQKIKRALTKFSPLQSKV